MKIYIAGPMTGLKNFNRKSFFLMAEELERSGFEPVHTADMPDGLEYEEYIEESFKRLAGCDAVLLLDDWDLSKGVMREIKHAHDKGIRIARNIYELHQIKEKLKC